MNVGNTIKYERIIEIFEPVRDKLPPRGRLSRKYEWDDEQKKMILERIKSFPQWAEENGIKIGEPFFGWDENGKKRYAPPKFSRIPYKILIDIREEPEESGDWFEQSNLKTSASQLDRYGIGARRAMSKNAYLLKNKDTPLSSFERLTDTVRAHGVSQTIYKIDGIKIIGGGYNLYPKGLIGCGNAEDITPETLFARLKRRKAPKNRAHIGRLPQTPGKRDDPLRYLQFTRGSSLNDAFRIDGQGAGARRADVNFYNNPLDDIAANVAFSGGGGEDLKPFLSSPEFTTDGATRKRRINKPDGIFLRKGEDPMFTKADGRSQAASEFYAAQVARALGIDCAPYTLNRYRHRDGRSETVCERPLFTSEDIGFVPAIDYFASEGGASCEEASGAGLR